MKKDYTFLFFFAGVLLVAAFFFNTPKEILAGSLLILKSPANLITDYFKIANVGAALFNAAVMALKGIGILWINRVVLNGLYMAAIFTIAGFSLFGKNLFNSIPIIFGVFCYAKFTGGEYKRCLPVAFFGTALGPLVSEIAFNLQLPLHFGIPLGILAGIFAGFVMFPLSEHFKSFYKGHNLYNIGFTAGFVGMLFIALLRAFNVRVETVNLVSEGHNENFLLLLLGLFSVLFSWGFWKSGRSFLPFKRLVLKAAVEDRDFVLFAGTGAAMMNMAVLGILATLYVVLVGGELNGPVIGGIFTVAGFGAYGKHVRNVVPVVLGVYLVGFFSFHDVASAPILLAALFGTTLAPISHAFGPLAGMAAGGLHVTMAVNIGYLHGGVNLYNNGFSGGFVAAGLVALLPALRDGLRRKKRPS